MLFETSLTFRKQNYRDIYSIKISLDKFNKNKIMNNQVVKKGITWLKRAVIFKAGKMILKKPASALGVGAVAAGAGIAAYSFLKDRKKKDLTRIDDIEKNNPEVEGKKKIVV